MQVAKEIGKQRWISCLVVFFVVLISEMRVNAQARAFLSVGTTQSFGGNITTFFAKSPSQWMMDLEVDKKVMGSLYVVSGLSSYGVGYSSTEGFFGQANSDYNARFISVPIMARWNIGNRNFFYVDFGLNTFFLASAHLKESIDKFNNGQYTSYEGEVSPYLNRITECFKFQETYAFKRLSISIFFIYQFKGQTVIKNLGDHWGLNVQQSTFLSSGGYSDFNLLGIKIGCRIR